MQQNSIDRAKRVCLHILLLHRIKAIVIIEEDIELTQNKGIKCAKISRIINEDDGALNALYGFVFNEYNINKNRGLIISYEVNSKSELSIIL